MGKKFPLKTIKAIFFKDDTTTSTSPSEDEIIEKITSPTSPTQRLGDEGSGHHYYIGSRSAGDTDARDYHKKYTVDVKKDLENKCMYCKCTAIVFELFMSFMSTINVILLLNR